MRRRRNARYLDDLQRRRDEAVKKENSPSTHSGETETTQTTEAAAEDTGATEISPSSEVEDLRTRLRKTQSDLAFERTKREELSKVGAVPPESEAQKARSNEFSERLNELQKNKQRKWYWGR